MYSYDNPSSSPGSPSSSPGSVEDKTAAVDFEISNAINQFGDQVDSCDVNVDAVNTNTGLLPSEIHYARAIIRKMHPLQDLELALALPMINGYPT